MRICTSRTSRAPRQSHRRKGCERAPRVRRSMIRDCSWQPPIATHKYFPHANNLRLTSMTLSTYCQVSKDIITTIILRAVFILTIKMRDDCRLFESRSIYIYIFRLWYILYFDSVNNGTVIFDFSTNMTNVHEARIIYNRIFTNVIYLNATLSRIYKSQPFYAQSDSLTPAQSFRVALDYLVSSDSPTYHDVSAHLRSFLCRAFTFFVLPARMLVLKPDRSVRTWLYNDEGLRTPTHRISLKDFRRSSRTARRRSQRCGNEETAARRQRSEEGRSKDEESESSCLSKGKRYLLGRWWSGGERNGGGSYRKWRSGRRWRCQKMKRLWSSVEYREKNIER